MNIICNNCHKGFDIPDYRYKTKKNSGQKNFYCSIECYRMTRVDREYNL